MAALLDTSVAIHLRDGGAAVIDKIAAFDDEAALSLVTILELTAGLAPGARRSAARDWRGWSAFIAC